MGSTVSPARGGRRRPCFGPVVAEPVEQRECLVQVLAGHGPRAQGELGMTGVTVHRGLRGQVPKLPPRGVRVVTRIW